MITILRNNNNPRNVNRALKALNEYLRYITKDEMLAHLVKVTTYLEPSFRLNPLITRSYLVVHITAGKITTTQLYQYLFFVLANEIFVDAEELTAYIDMYGRNLLL